MTNSIEKTLSDRSISVGSEIKKTFLSIALIVLVLVKTFYNTDILALPIVLFTVLLMFDPEYLVPVLFTSAILDENSFFYSNITTSRFFTLFFILVFALEFVRKKVKVKTSLFLYSALLLIFFFFSAAFSPSGLESSFITTLLNILLVVSMASILRADLLKKVFGLMAVAAFLLVAYIFLQYLLGDLSESSYGGFDLLGSTNKNQVGMALCQIGALSFALFVCQKNEWNKIKRLAVLFVVFLSFVLLILSGSKSSLVGLVLSVVACLIYNIKNEKEAKKRFLTRFLYIAAFAVCLLVALYIINSNEDLAYRFSLQTIIESGGTGRTEIWKTVLKEGFLNHPLFGIGFGGNNVMSLLISNGVNHSGTHNMFLDILVQLGLFGFVFLVSGLLVLLTKLLKKTKEYSYALVPLTLIIAAVGNGIGENIWTTRFLWISIGIAVVIAYADISSPYKKVSR